MLMFLRLEDIKILAASAMDSSSSESDPVDDDEELGDTVLERLAATEGGGDGK